MVHLRPRLDEQCRRRGESGGESTGNHGAVENGDEEDGWVEECRDGVAERETSLLERGPGVHGQICLPCSRGVVDVLVVTRDAVYGAEVSKMSAYSSRRALCEGGDDVAARNVARR